MLQRLAIASFLAFSTSACLVNVSHTSNPDRYFDEAMKAARAVAGEEGPAKELRVLVYDADDRKLVRVEIPLGLVRRLAADGDFDWDLDDHDICRSGGRGCSEMKRKLRRFRGKDLDKLPLGPLVEVTEDDGERVFVYLR
jgi:hypothetical protein